MPVRSGDTWKVTGIPDAIYWIPLSCGGGSYGGRYTVGQVTGECAEVNAFTGDCTCPAGFSEDTLDLDMANVDGLNQKAGVIFCYML